MRWLDDLTNSMEMNKLQEMMKDREAAGHKVVRSRASLSNYTTTRKVQSSPKKQQESLGIA